MGRVAVEIVTPGKWRKPEPLVYASIMSEDDAAVEAIANSSMEVIVTGDMEETEIVALQIEDMEETEIAALQIEDMEETEIAGTAAPGLGLQIEVTVETEIAGTKEEAAVIEDHDLAIVNTADNCLLTKIFANLLF